MSGWPGHPPPARPVPPVHAGRQSAGRGRGLATRAVILVSRCATGEGVKQAVIRVEPENAASSAVARRAGFTPGKHTHGADGTRLDWYMRDLCIDTR
ncbi:GNAT family N-acetyltransferase [Streptomyces minutiscleroticus]|uniref:GNAT family N-acetyltransferase n=1 Tax=Streptomyces minutiscleroticus TaxID=68238 RepID=UPI0027E484E9|nr:GNAT family N-acetyltransferase [Streptomyces minutiscleroticus]